MNYLGKEIDVDEIMAYENELEAILINGTEEEKEEAGYFLHLCRTDEFFALEQLWDRKATDEEKANRAEFEAAVKYFYS